MKRWQYREIMSFQRDWVREEGLCRFCDRGRLCGWSRRGRQECPSYRFANEMDCFHLWIAFFDRPAVFRKGYDAPESYPWINEESEADVPPGSPSLQPTDKQMAREVRTEQLKKKKYRLMQEIDDAGRKLEQVKAQIKKLENKNSPGPTEHKHQD